MIPTTSQRSNIDPFASPPAGISLAQDNTKYPWGNPAKYANPDDAMTAALDSLERPSNKTNLIKLLFAGVSVESLVEGYVYEGFESGRFSVNTGLLMKAPLAMYLANIAEEEGIPYRLFESDNPLKENEISDKNMLSVMKKNNPAMFSFLREKLSETARMGVNKPEDPAGFIQSRGNQ
jgi:hypothetical protein